MSDQSIVKEYKDQNLTVVWKPGLCIHSKNCFNGLPKVFNPNQRPWINMDGADNSQIQDQIKKCPSGALSFYLSDQDIPSKEDNDHPLPTKIEMVQNGPLIVHGSFELSDTNGESVSKSGKTALCRCGASGNKPFCDGSHKRVDFVG